MTASAGGVGPGSLVLVCGPIGAGKDALLHRVREMNQHRTGIVFPRRVVTRSMSDAEDHDTATPEEFTGILKGGGFAFWWSAHGLHYGVPSSIDDEIARGSCVVCNVSRTIISDLRARYQRVIAVLVTAPPDILASRLAGRGRTTDGKLSDRLARSATIKDVHVDVVIDNSGSIEEGARKLQAALEDQSPSDRLSREA